jgi:hypothetical protein
MLYLVFLILAETEVLGGLADSISSTVSHS